MTSHGRSRAFVNDTLVTAAALKDQMSPLLELHGQHEHQTLLDPQSHLHMLDQFAALGPDRDAVAAAFREWRSLQSELDGFQMDEREKAARLDLLTFQIDELDKARVRAGEDEELETTRRVLANADKLQRVCDEAYAALYDSDEAARRIWELSGSGWASWPPSTSCFNPTSTRGTASSRSSRIWR